MAAWSPELRKNKEGGSDPIRGSIFYIFFNVFIEQKHLRDSPGLVGIWDTSVAH